MFTPDNADKSRVVWHIVTHFDGKQVVQNICADESQAAAGATLSHFGKRLWATAQLFSRPSRATTKIGVASLKIKLTAILCKIHGAEIT
ncbi:hypothetical protein CEXT_116771 [Caerostris extrusa]|uniref:Uncharacterized protein n=1 Tax=Caerostris extrusa TaxID=172846 RepID=A0AAV4PQ73_CAEEX|nr:hypothetical protein CEXT_116771 [Caerostris extrusa]